MIEPIGVLLAAGRGKRMGGRKQFFSVPTAEGEKPLVCAGFDAIAPVCQSMIVVLGHLADEVAAVLGDRKFHRVVSDPDAPMFESVRAGLHAAQEIDAGASVLLQPADHAEVSRETLDKLLAAAAVQSDRVIIPEVAGQGGHPALVPAIVVRGLVAADCPLGLGEYWKAHPELCVRIAVDDESVVRDLDSLE